MRLAEAVEGDDGKFDEQAALSIVFGLTLVFLTVFVVVVRHEPFDPFAFAGAAATFLGGSMGALTVRSRWSKGGENADVSDQPGK